MTDSLGLLILALSPVLFEAGVRALELTQENEEWVVRVLFFFPLVFVRVSSMYIVITPFNSSAHSTLSIGLQPLSSPVEKKNYKRYDMRITFETVPIILYFANNVHVQAGALGLCIVQIPIHTGLCSMPI